MKVKVVMPFKDKHTKVIYQKGREIEVTEERYEELTSAAQGPFVEYMLASPEPKKTIPQKKPVTKKNKK
jgi:hypothetical protein